MTNPQSNRVAGSAALSGQGGLRRAIGCGRPLYGAWVQIGHPACAEILAKSGFDWVCVDLEHGAIGIDTMADLFRAVEAAGSVPVARLPANDPVWIHRSLDAGALGLIIPMVNTAEQAVAAGYTLIALGIDTVFLQQEAARALALARRPAGR